MKAGNKQDIEKLIEYGSKAQELFPEISERINTPKYKLSDLSLKARKVTNWQEKDLFFKPNIPGSWYVFDLIDAVWIDLIKQLRTFNISLELIKNLKDELIQNFKDMESEESKKIMHETVHTLAGDKNKEMIDKLLQSDEIKEFLSTLKINLLETILLDIIIFRNHFKLLIDSEGDFLLYKENFEDAYYNTPESKAFLRSSHISLSINQSLINIMGDLEQDSSALETYVSTSEEVEVIKAIREKGNSNIEVIMSRGENSTPETLKITKDKKIDASKRVIELLMSEGYQDIIIKTQKGIIASCKNIRKIKLNKKSTE